MTRSELTQGDVFRYNHPRAKRGLRMVCSNPKGKDGLYSVRLADGELMHSNEGSDSAQVWPVEVVPVWFALDAEDVVDLPF